MIYRKYQFADVAAFEQALASYGEQAISVAAPGVLVIAEAVLGDDGAVHTPPLFTEGFAADIIWGEEAPAELEEFEVWPLPGTELHSIAGMQLVYAESYALKHI